MLIFPYHQFYVKMKCSLLPILNVGLDVLVVGWIVKRGFYFDKSI